MLSANPVWHYPNIHPFISNEVTILQRSVWHDSFLVGFSDDFAPNVQFLLHGLPKW
jgi:hypothetical protein